MKIKSQLEIGVVLGGYVIEASRPVLEGGQVLVDDGMEAWDERTHAFMDRKAVLRFVAKWLRDIERSAGADKGLAGVEKSLRK